MLNRFLKPVAALATVCLLSAPAFAGGEGWTHDYEAAKTQASEEGKDMLLDFTGSDWCGWCIKLVDEVFSKDQFKTYADANLVLVEIDFPRDKSKLSDETKAQNDALKDQFGIRGFPTIILADSKGRPYAKTGYQRGGPENYVAHLTELKKVRSERDEHFAAAEKAEGVEKAKHLHAALQAVGDDLAVVHYKPTIESIIELDADNEAGLKKHYEQIGLAKQQRADMMAMMRSAGRDAEALVTKIDEFLKNEELVTPLRQEVLAIKSQVQLNGLKDKAAAKATLIQAIEIDPESDMGKQLKQALDRVFSDDA